MIVEKAKQSHTLKRHKKVLVKEIGVTLKYNTSKEFKTFHTSHETTRIFKSHILGQRVTKSETSSA